MGLKHLEDSKDLTLNKKDNISKLGAPANPLRVREVSTMMQETDHGALELETKGVGLHQGSDYVEGEEVERKHEQSDFKGLYCMTRGLRYQGRSSRECHGIVWTAPYKTTRQTFSEE
jgi:hypothetical protein